MGRKKNVASPEQIESAQSKRARRRVFWACLPVLLISTLVIVVAVGVIGRHLSAPDWLRNRIEARLAIMLPETQVSFGDLVLNVERNGLARLVLRDVDIATKSGAPIVSFSDVRIGVRPWSVLTGTPQLRTVTLSGAFVTVRRDRDGQFGLSFGDAMASEGAVPDLPTIVRRFDNALQSPHLAHLTTVSADALTLRFEDARARRAWTVDGGRADLVRDFGTVTIRGDFAVLSGGDSAASVSINVESDEGEDSLKLGVSLTDMASEDISSQGPALAWLRAVRAPISGALRAEMFEDGSLGPLNATLQIGQGVLQPNEQTRPIPFTHARTYFTYRPDEAALTFDEISLASSWADLEVSGRATLQEINNGWPARMLGQFSLRNVRTNPDGFFDQSLEFAKADLDFMLELDPFHFRLGQLYLDDPDLPLHLSGDLIAAPEGWQVSADARLTDLTRDRLEQLWPSHLKPITRRWLMTNLLAGNMSQGHAAIRSEPGKPVSVHIDADFEDTTLRFLNRMPPIEKGLGKFTVQSNRMVVWLREGQIQGPQGGALDVGGSAFEVPDIAVPEAPVVVHMDVKGAITAALSVLDLPPLGVMQRAKQPVDLAEGDVRAKGRLDFALKDGLRPSDFAFQTTAELMDVSTAKLVPDKTLAARALALKADNSGIELSGDATIDGVPLAGTWRQPLGDEGKNGSAFRGTLRVSDGFARSLGIALPQDMLSGSTNANLEIRIKQDVPPEFELTSDLSGLGAQVAPLGWRISKDATGQLEIAGKLSNPAQIDLLSIQAGKLSAQGTVALNEAGGLDRIEFASVRMADWLNAPVTLVGRGDGQAPEIQINTGSLDMRRVPSSGPGAGAGGGDATPISLALDSLQISEGMRLTGFRGAFDAGAGLNGEFSARLNGDAPISGVAVAQNGRTAFRVRSDDAGRVLKAAGLIRSAKSGKMDLTFVPTKDEGVYDGTLKIQGISLQDAPAIAGLLDAISIVGLIDEMESAGIFFANVEVQFRLTPERVIVTRSSATGPSMGLAVDGYYDLASGQMDMQGTLSPLYLLNGIGSIFTRKGEGLIGFGFTLKGTAEAPDVNVNPFSVLTPGMFREIFRRPPPQVSQ